MKSMDNLLFDRTMIPLMNRGLDAYALRQKAIANNVANVESDGYERRIVHFEDELQDAIAAGRKDLARTHPDHLPKPWEMKDVVPQLDVDNSEDYFNGHNNVDIDREMTELSRALLSFNFSARVTRGSFDTLHLAIRGTR